MFINWIPLPPLFATACKKLKWKEEMNSEIEVVSINSAFPPPPDKDFHDFRNFLLSGFFFVKIVWMSLPHHPFSKTMLYVCLGCIIWINCILKYDPYIHCIFLGMYFILIYTQYICNLRVVCHHDSNQKWWKIQ